MSAGADVPPAGEHVVIAAALRRAGRLLLVHRSPLRAWYPDAWELPGGHVEPGEDPRRALHRELAEELGVDAVIAGERFARVERTDFVMAVWVVGAWSGTVVNRSPHEHDALAWVGPDDLVGLRLADPSLPGLVRAALAAPSTGAVAPRPVVPPAVVRSRGDE